MHVNWARNQGVLIAKPVGRIFSADHFDWEAELEAGIGPDDKRLVVDFDGVSFLGSAGLRVLVRTARRFSGPGRGFAICTLRHPIHKVISTSGFDSFLPVFDSEDAAVAALTGGDGTD